MTTTGTPLTVSTLIDGQRIRRMQVQLVVLCGLAVLLDGADTIAIGLVGPGMAHTVGVPAATLGTVYSASQFGFLVGALIFGPLGDRIGRKPVLVGAVLLFGAATTLTITATTVPMLIALRSLTGLSLGGAAPVALALVAEYLPTRARATTVALSWAAFPLGGVVIGLASGVLLAHGWQSLFALLGGISVVVGVLLFIAAPESLTFLVNAGDKPQRTRKILTRLAPEHATANLTAEERKPAGVPVKHLFTSGRTARTLLLWSAFFASYLPLVFVTNWSPTILHQHGLTAAQVGVAITINSLGSAIGSAAIGRGMDRWGTHRTVLAALLCATTSLVLLGMAVGGFAGVAVAITAAGVFSGAGQTGITALASLLYPTTIRSTALGWAMAVGRLGAAVGPLLGGAMLAAAWGPVPVFGAVAVFPAVALLCVLLIRTLRAREARPIR